MSRFLQLVCIAVVAICGPARRTEAKLMSASSYPCELGQLTVAYGDEVWPCGAIVPIDELGALAPSVTLAPSQTDANYFTLFMVDPDVPSRERSGGFYWLHWLVINLKKDDLDGFDGNSGTVLKEYHPPSPPKGSGLHRYQFFVFEQPKEFSQVIAPEERANFDLELFRDENDLTDPVAGYQFRTQRE